MSRQRPGAQIYFSLLPYAEKPGPSLIYSLSLIEERLSFLQKLEKTFDCHFLMAVKAFPANPVIKLAAKYLSGFDISNLREWQSIANYSHRKVISITSPSYNPKSFVNLSCRDKKLIFNCDQVRQYTALMRIEQPQSYVIRLNSNAFLAKKTLSRFGVRADELSLLEQLLTARQHKFLGFHLHSGWQQNQTSDYIRLAEGAVKLSKKMNRSLGLLNLGGGFGEFSEFKLSKMIEKVRQAIPRNTQLFFEAGRYISQNSGFAIGHIENIFEFSKQQFVVLDLSKDCHLQWSQPKVFFPGNISKLKKSTVNFCGPTCSEVDVLGKLNYPILDSSIPGKKVIGSPIFFSNISSYSMARNHSFNGIPKARIHFVK